LTFHFERLAARALPVVHVAAATEMVATGYAVFIGRVMNGSTGPQGIKGLAVP
jgi:hypothetical protein